MKTRNIAHIILEATTALKVGSNASDFIQDSPVQKDFNNLPMILGTSITGVLRKDFDEKKVDDIFGNENGSKVIISNALLLDENNQVNETLLLNKSSFLQLFNNLPIREHTSITDKGVAKEHSKFDEEVVYKGTKFKFSIECLDDENTFNTILELLLSKSFRLGGGSTKGFGKMKVIDISTQSYDINSYIDYSSSLNHKLLNSYNNEEKHSKTHVAYNLKITPDDFFMFGSGFGDSDADMTPVYEKSIDYKNKRLSEDMILIPASSIKGALAHRSTYHYNLANNLFVGSEYFVTNLKEIFGEAKDKDINGSKGKILISDCYKTKSDEKVFDHVSIDRFTGGAIDGALFQEKTIADDREYEIEILMEKDVDDRNVLAFERALKDITTGMLALGGATTKGHGIFKGEILKNGELYEIK